MGQMVWSDGGKSSFFDWNTPYDYQKAKELQGHIQLISQYSILTEQDIAIFNLNTPHPLSDPSVACTAMILTAPLHATNWVQVPCEYAFKSASYICQESVNQLSEAPSYSQNNTYIDILDVTGRTCPNDWWFIDGYCFKIHPIQIEQSPLDLLTMCNTWPWSYTHAKTHSYFLVSQSILKQGRDSCHKIGAVLANLAGDERRESVLIKHLALLRHYGSEGDIMGDCHVLSTNLEPASFQDDASSIQCPWLKVFRHRYLDRKMEQLAVSMDYRGYWEMKNTIFHPVNIAYWGYQCIQTFQFSIRNALCQKNPTDTNVANNPSYRAGLSNNNKQDVTSAGEFFGNRTYFTCKNREVILVSNLCDGKTECSNAEDEEDCANNTDAFMYNCESGEAIHVSKYCNFVPDCLDGSDETNCIHPTCMAEEFMCSNGQCINGTYRCDLEINCLDKSDEIGCSSLSLCPEFKCLSQACISAKYVGDGVPDCPGYLGEDELEEHQPNTCEEGFKRCSLTTKPCFDLKKVCVYERDSMGNLKHCRKGEHIQGCSNFTCQSSKYIKCPESYCIPTHKVCDGVLDCVDGYDEKNCFNLSCPGFFRCKYDGTCLHPSHVCDGIIHCSVSADDELFCGVAYQSCPPGCFCEGHVLKCENIGLKGIPNYSDQIRGLFLKKNEISIVPKMFEQLQLLGLLDLSNNMISIVHRDVFYNLLNLVSLNLQDNNISNILSGTFRDLHQLKELLLVNNPIQKLLKGSFEGLSSLPSLVLSQKSIYYVEDGCFSDLRSLKRLNISHNSLESLTIRVFQGLNDLEKLDISGNPLKFINESVFFSLPDTLHIVASSFHICCYVEHTKSCEPRADLFSSCENLFGTATLKVVMWITGCLIFTGNTFLLLMNVFHKASPVRYINQNSFVFYLQLVSNIIIGLHVLILCIADYVYAGIFSLEFVFWTQHPICKTLGVIFPVSFGITNWGVVLLYFNFHFTTCSRISKISIPNIFILVVGFLYFILALNHLSNASSYENGFCMSYALADSFRPHEEWVIMFWVLPTISLVVYVSLYLYLCLGTNALVRFQQTHDDRSGHGYFALLGVVNILPWCIFFPISIALSNGVDVDLSVREVGMLSLLVPCVLFPVMIRYMRKVPRGSNIPK